MATARGGEGGEAVEEEEEEREGQAEAEAPVTAHYKKGRETSGLRGRRIATCACLTSGCSAASGRASGKKKVEQVRGVGSSRQTLSSGGVPRGTGRR